MMNSLDSFNKDKTKCEKCKIYFDKFIFDGVNVSKLCARCDTKFHEYWLVQRHSKKIILLKQNKETTGRTIADTIYEDFINEQ